MWCDPIFISKVSMYSFSSVALSMRSWMSSGVKSIEPLRTSLPFTIIWLAIKYGLSYEYNSASIFKCGNFACSSSLLSFSFRILLFAFLESPSRPSWFLISSVADSIGFLFLCMSKSSFSSPLIQTSHFP